MNWRATLTAPAPTAPSSSMIPKQRRRSAPRLFRDRVVHRPVNVIRADLRAQIHLRQLRQPPRRRASHRALDRAQYFADAIATSSNATSRPSFPAVDHDILKAILWRHIAGRRRALADGANHRQRPGDPGRPIPAALVRRRRPAGGDSPAWPAIGNQTSQFWANVYLNPLRSHFR